MTATLTVQVGECSDCGGPVLWRAGTGASCPCGETIIPDEFFRVAVS